MKSVKTTAKRFASLAFLSLSMSGILMTGCDNGQPEDSEKIAEDQNEERFDDRKSEKDAEFLVKAAAINMEEIELGELAQQKGTLQEVKDLGKMMVDEHTAALDELKQLAEEKAISLPGSLTEDGQDAYDRLNEKSGKDFNEKYCDMMIRGHKDAIDKFEKAASDADDPDIRNWASSMLPSLRTHLEHSRIAEEKCKAMK
ncbi:MAG: hypothetical protein A3D31_18880 [Candidatus Fluviicola riflensis]|nr:MAG: hypothetical protein A3D31_18880 [Candidatus Fluviicola riflensis]OGS83534.1 MAG: hypothetical protein A2724_18895 [Fluviicola sp. RIFCSPHIGHO2_01_FULL_43_53]OGS85673.1 MAG: hypothetical protein A3E30_18425 [Fluviicola sp. RIFCSPHIGHO2_12_FULL_43_24]